MTLFLRKRLLGLFELFAFPSPVTIKWTFKEVANSFGIRNLSFVEQNSPDIEILQDLVNFQSKEVVRE